jgi:hypothetical protein
MDDSFVKAASDADDARYGWGLSEAYREEIRKLRALPSDLPAPALLWTVDDDIAGVRWVILCFEYVDGAPPRRPWRPEELRLVIDALAQLAPLVGGPSDRTRGFQPVAGGGPRVGSRVVDTLCRQRRGTSGSAGRQHLDRPRWPGVDLRLELAVACMRQRCAASLGGDAVRRSSAVLQRSPSGRPLASAPWAGSSLSVHPPKSEPVRN